MGDESDWLHGPPEQGRIVWVAFDADGNPIAVWGKLAQALAASASEGGDRPSEVWKATLVKRTERLARHIVAECVCGSRWRVPVEFVQDAPLDACPDCTDGEAEG